VFSNFAMRSPERTLGKAADKIIAEIALIGRSAVPALLVAAENKNLPRIRKWSLQALGAIGDKRAGPVLMDALADEQMTVRLHSLRGLAKSRKGSCSRSSFPA
jgi:HEAT repeat protein